MAYVLVVTNDIPPHPKGAILRNQTDIDRLRTSEYALQAVQVSDEVIPPPAPPPPPPDLTAIQAAVQGVNVKNQQQDAALAAANSVNAQQQDALAQQTVKLAAQDTTIAALNATVSDQNNKLAASAAALAAMEARLAALETAPPPPVPIDTADDLPLGEDDGDILTTAAGDPLVGDDKLD